MNSTALITRPGRAAAVVAAVGLLFGAQGALALHDFGAGGSATAGFLLAALAAATVALGVLAPLHSRLGAISVSIVRAGLVVALVPVGVSLAAGRSTGAPILVAGLCVAASSMALLAFARRHEGDLPGRLLELTLGGTVLGTVLAADGGCLLPGAAWLALAAVLWAAYASPGATAVTAGATAGS